MDNVTSAYKAIVAVIGGGVVGVLGGWDVALQVLVTLVVIDYITGVLAAWYGKKLDSNVGAWGIARKVLLFVPVAVGYMLDNLLATEVLRSVAIFFYIANEGLSIFENLGQLNVLVPDVLKNALKQLNDKNKGGGGNV